MWSLFFSFNDDSFLFILALISSSCNMGKKCVVPRCPTNFGLKIEANKGRSLFKPPADETRLTIWEENIPFLDNRPKLVRSKHFVCDLHFVPDEIIQPVPKKQQVCGKNKPGNPQLTKDAVPVLFPSTVNSFFTFNVTFKINHLFILLIGLPSYYSKRVPMKRKDPSLRLDAISNTPAKKKKSESGNSNSAGPSCSSNVDVHPVIEAEEPAADYSELITSIRLPGVGWSRAAPPVVAATPTEGTDASSQFYFAQTRLSAQSGVGVIVYKMVQVDLAARTIGYHIGNSRVSHESLPEYFDSSDSLEGHLLRFNGVKVCDGIPDERYTELGGLSIPSATLKEGVWRSNRYSVYKR